MCRPIFVITLVAALFAGCVNVAPPPNRSAIDPSDPSAPEASARRYRPNLVATAQVYLDPSVGEGAQKMDHSKMQGMEGMGEMDHSKMPGMEQKQPPGTSPAPSQPMDHSKMPGMEQKDPPAPASKEALDAEMKKTSDEMKKLSDELKAKSDAAKASEKKKEKSPTPERKQ